MGRPSKLSDRQWSDLLRRLASGERAVDLAKHFKVSQTSISKRVSQDAEFSKSLAGSLAQVEARIESLPVSQQGVIRDLATQLKQASTSLAAAAVNGAQINERLTGLAVKRLREIDEQSDPEALKPIAALVATGNEASKTALALVNANKGQSQGETSLEDLLEQVNRRQHG